MKRPSKYQRLREENARLHDYAERLRRDLDDEHRRCFRDAEDHFYHRSAAIQQQNEQLLKQLTRMASLQAHPLFILEPKTDPVPDDIRSRQLGAYGIAEIEGKASE